MYRRDGKLVVSPSDLTTFWESEFASWMDRLKTDHPDEAPASDEEDAQKTLLFGKGMEHEAAVLAAMRAAGKRVETIDASRDRPEKAAQATIQALRRGVDVVYQGYLTDGPLAGFSDFLVRVETPSPGLGAFSYEVWDSKLAQKVKPYYVLQLCAYSQMLARVQGMTPARIAVVLGDRTVQHLSTHEFLHYYLKVKERFDAFHAAFDKTKRPDPEKYRSYGRWETHAAATMEKADSLTQIAGIRASQLKKLRAAGVHTMAGLAASQAGVPGLNGEVLARLKRQCELQIKSRGCDVPHFEVLDHAAYAEDMGLFGLPPPSPRDVYFDMEGFPLVKGGLEYLWGATYFEGGASQFRDFWAHDATEEKAALEAFVDWVYGLWTADPSSHVYHYASYEISAIRRLMGRYGTREAQVDELLRAGVFVDLYQVVKEALAVGTASYSIKAIERLYRGRRDTDVKDGGASIVVYNDWLKTSDGATWRESPLLRSIRDYNKDDCDTMVELVVFLRQLQEQHGLAPTPRDYAAAQKDARAVSRKTDKEEIDLLTKTLAEAATKRAEGLVLSHLVGFHARELKPAWWKFFERHRQAESALVDDDECLFRLTKKPDDATDTVYLLAKDREHKVKEGDEFTLKGVTRGAKHVVAAIDWKAGEIRLEKAARLPSPATLVPTVFDISGSLIKAVATYARAWLDGTRGRCAVAQLLRKEPPRLEGRTLAAVTAAHPNVTDAFLEASKALDSSYLIVQGPPGSGKTTKSAVVIAALLKAGHRVAVASTTHEAVNNLLRKCVEELDRDAAGRTIKIAKVRREADADQFESPRIKNIASGAAVPYTASGPRLVGGTAFAFASPKAIGQYDYLFVDEAGQVSVANLVAMGLASKNIVLMGDQMQLSQPTQGSHPGESGLSTLDYLLGGVATVPADRGIFFPISYRMHSSVCRIVSEMVYEGRLTSDAPTDAQRIVAGGPTLGTALPESGVVFVPVEHEGRSHSSEEEVLAVVEIVRSLKARLFVGKDGKERGKLRDEDILVVAPYNLQVLKLKDALGASARVGTIDKFQGQEAPVVILSMAASDLDSVPRGVEFLLDKNRMNVALSRAMCLAVVVGSEAIARAYVGRVDDMRLVNFYCRVVAARGGVTSAS
jgi:uncharacterized protein